ncbi:J domain-containing protein [Rubrobacter marinus]|nr:J domain-containing protein [Rubrobacter marinus]
MLAITGISEGETTRLLVSNKARAVRFARPFGSGKEEAPRGDARTAREARARRNAEAEAEKNETLYKVLGVEPGASQAEVHAAYKKKARMYHPDRVASLAPEVREMAELRMKEINAAYGEIKRKKSTGAR